MISNWSTKILVALFFLPSLLLAQESEFVEDRSNSVVEYVESDQKSTESTDADVKDDKIKKSDIVDSLNATKILIGAHSGSSFAMPLGLSTTEDVEFDSEEADATWIGAKVSVGAALSFYLNRRMAVVTGLDYQMLYYKTTSEVPRHCKMIMKGLEYRGDGMHQEFDETQIGVSYTQNRSITYHLASVPVSFRYHFMDEVWGQFGVGLNYILKGNDIYESALVQADIDVIGYYQPTPEISIPQYGNVFTPYPPTEEPAKKEFIPSLLLSVGKSWMLGKLNLDAALSLTYALKTIDFDYGLSANTFTIGLDLYAYYSLTKEKK